MTKNNYHTSEKINAQFTDDTQISQRHYDELVKLDKHSYDLKGHDGLLQVTLSPGYQKDSQDVTSFFGAVYQPTTLVNHRMFHPTRHGELIAMTHVLNDLDEKEVKKKLKMVNGFIKQVPKSVLNYHDYIMHKQNDDKPTIELKDGDVNNNDEPVDDFNEEIGKVLEDYQLSNTTDESKQDDKLVDDKHHDSFNQSIESILIDKDNDNNDDKDDDGGDDKDNEKNLEKQVVKTVQAKLVEQTIQDYKYGPNLKYNGKNSVDMDNWIPVLGGDGNFIGLYRNKEYRKDGNMPRYAIIAYTGSPVASKQFNDYVKKTFKDPSKTPTITEFIATDPNYARLQDVNKRNVAHLIDQFAKVVGAKIHHEVDYKTKLDNSFETHPTMAQLDFVQEVNTFKPYKHKGKTYMAYYNMCSPNEKFTTNKVGIYDLSKHDHMADNKYYDIDSDKYGHSHFTLSGPLKHIKFHRKRKNKPKNHGHNIIPVFTGTNINDTYEEGDYDNKILVNKDKVKSTFCWDGMDKDQTENKRLKETYYNSYDEHADKRSQMGFKTSHYFSHTFTPIMAKICN